MKKSTLFTLLICLVIFCSVLFSQAQFQCDSDCPRDCEKTGKLCHEYDPCCGYCTDDGGKTKHYCCESCEKEPI